MLNKSKNKAEKPKTRKAKGRTVGCKQLRIKKYITIKVITILICLSFFPKLVR